MNARISATGLIQILHHVLGGSVFSFFFLSLVAQAAPVVVSVDHRVSVTYSAPKLDAKKGVYATQVRIMNRSGAALYAPLRLAFDQTALKEIHLLNAHGTGKDGQQYFEVALHKEQLTPGAVTKPVGVIFTLEKTGKDAEEKAVMVGGANKLTTTLSSAQRVSAVVKQAPLEPSAYPNVLPVGQGKVNVLFTVQIVGGTETNVPVNLRRVGDRKSIAMNDRGENGDLNAKDGVYGASILIDTDKMKADTCEKYEVVAGSERAVVVSPTTKLCVSSFPVRAAASDTTHPLELQDGSKAVADEVIISVKPDTNADVIRRLADKFNAKVVGSILSHNLYQLKLPAAVSVGRLLELLAQMRTYPGVESASPNGIGSLAGVLPNASQHGLKQVLEYDTWSASGKGVWDSGAAGSNVTVVVLDSGINRLHPDFGTPGNCQLAENDCGSASTDISPINHGTMVAGIIAASGGAAGVAQGSKIHSIRIGSYFAPNYTINILQMIDAFDGSNTNTPASISNSAKGYITSLPLTTGKVINASFYGGPWGTSGWATLVSNLCKAINNTVLSGAVVVNAAGNKGADDYYYPARCNDHPDLARKDLFITVANSSSVSGSVTDTTYLDTVTTQTTTLAFDQLYPSSNHGLWVDIAAPGVQINTTASGSGYASPIGTSFSSPFVAGAAALLYSCGVALDQIETKLKSSTATVTLPVSTTLPAGGTVPRLDIYQALKHSNLPPTGVTPSNFSVYENVDTTSGYVFASPLIAMIAPNDITCGTTHTFSIPNPLLGDQQYFDIGTGVNAGKLMLKAGVSLSHNAKPIYNVMVRVTDYWNATFDQAVVVNVLGVNHSPAGTNTTVTTNEDTTYTFSAANFGFTDPLDSPPNNLSEVIITTVPAVGQLKLGAATVLAGQHVVAASLGNLTFMPASQANGIGYASFTFQVVDDGGLANGGDNTDHTPNTLTINVTPVNDAPAGTDATVTTIENTAYTFSAANFGFTDPLDSPPNNLSAVIITTVPAVGQLKLGAVGVMAGQTVAAANLGNLTFMPAANASGAPYTSFTFQVVDDGGGLNSDATPNTLTINVTPTVNNPPIIAAQSFNHIEYDQITPSPSFNTNVGTVIANDPDGDALAFTITAGNDADVNGVHYLNVLRFDAGGQLVVDKPLGFNFEYKPVFNLIVQVSDGTLSATAPVTVTLSDDTNDHGDPHINAVGGLHYDFQSAGEFVALRGAKGMEIQTRQTPVSTAAPIADSYSGLPVGVSVNTAVAARVGKHRVTYQMKDNGNSASSGLELRVDGVVTTPLTEGLDLGSGGRVATAPGNGIQIDFPDETTLIAIPNWWAGNNVWYLDIDVFHTTAREGIMGARYKGSWLPRLSDGSALGAMPAAMHDRYVELYVKFADSWRVNDETSLFHYAPDTSTNTFTFKEWPKENGPYVIGNGPVAKPLARNIATQLCRGVVGKNEKADCEFDVMVTGNRGIAKSHLLSQQIRTGLTSITVRDDRGISKDKEMVTFTATVARHAASTRMELDRKVGTLTGEIQFTINGNSVGRPVKLDARGQAQLKLPRLKIEKQTIGARYIPVKGSVFFPSSSFESARLVVEGKR